MYPSSTARIKGIITLLVVFRNLDHNDASNVDSRGYVPVRNTQIL